MRYAAVCGCCLLATTALPPVAPAQGRWAVEAKTSLAWWQVDPHLNHLWSTTCPGEPSWRPGEGRSGGWSINPNLKLPRTGYANDSDTLHTPLYPRPAGAVTPVCVEAVRGEITAADTVTWRGVRGQIVVLADALVSGERMRDVFMHQIMQTTQYPEIKFTLDSVTSLTRQADTLSGMALGTLDLHGVKMPVAAWVHAYHDGGGLRVLGKFHFPAEMLEHELGYTKIYHMGLGVRTGIWHTLFMGVDMVLKPAH